MHIKFSPQRRDDTLEVIKDGDKLRINGDLFSFISVPEGATIPAGAIPCDWITGPVDRIDGEIHLTLLLPHGPHPSNKIAFPQPLLNPEDGKLTLPTDPIEEPSDVDA